MAAAGRVQELQQKLEQCRSEQAVLLQHIVAAVQQAVQVRAAAAAASAAALGCFAYLVARALPSTKLYK
jgi:hypothetical protein